MKFIFSANDVASRQRIHCGYIQTYEQTHLCDIENLREMWCLLAGFEGLNFATCGRSNQV